MANVRKVSHPSGSIAWRATIKTSAGKRSSKNFARKGAADAWVKANDGASASGSATMTFLDLARSHNAWFDGLVDAGERDRVTYDRYDSHRRTHLEADTGSDDSGPLKKVRLSDIDGPALQGFLERRIAASGSMEVGRRLKRTLSAWCAHGERRGWLKGNPARSCKITAKKRRKASKVEIPSKDALGRLLKAATEGPAPERDTAVVNLLLFAGLRISELLGMADASAQLRARSGGQVNVLERLCTRYVTMGDVKSEDGLREIPIGTGAANAVKAWRLARGPSSSFAAAGKPHAGRLFPGPASNHAPPLWAYRDFRRQCWDPMMTRAGLASERVIESSHKGKAFRHKRLSVDFGPHELRHAYASIQIENRVTPKRLQELMGHATLAMTMDLYGHLWRNEEADQEMAEAAERAVPRLA